MTVRRTHDYTVFVGTGYFQIRLYDQPCSLSVRRPTQVSLKRRPKQYLLYEK